MKRLLGLLLFVGLIAISYWWLKPHPSETAGQTVAVKRGSVSRTATAVGRIEVAYEVPVNSLSGGILTHLYVQLGQRVEAGDPLAEIRPVLSERAVLQAERAVEQAMIAEAAAREYVENGHLASYLTQFYLGSTNVERMHRQAELNLKEAQEQLQLLKEGRVTMEGHTLDYVVRAPVSGHVLDIRYREGAPIVPSSFYGTGSEFVTLADLDNLVFRGTVDEIDAGRLKEGMRANLKIGSLPEARVRAELVEIARRSTLQNNATVFRVLMELETPADVMLRSGYSAVAEIETDRRDAVLVVPERLVEYREGGTFVSITGPGSEPAERAIQTGLSDGLTVEVTAGLEEGDLVLERSFD
jgi:HlyD family secretion protein